MNRDHMEEIIGIINKSFDIHFNNLELMRDMGSASYTAGSNGHRYFLRVIKPALFDTATTGTEVQVFLYNQGFPVTPIVFSKENLPYVKLGDPHSMSGLESLRWHSYILMKSREYSVLIWRYPLFILTA